MQRKGGEKKFGEKRRWPWPSMESKKNRSLELRPTQTLRSDGGKKGSRSKKGGGGDGESDPDWSGGSGKCAHELSYIRGGI